VGEPAGRVAVVTGASRGIGRAVALALAAAGADVACLATTAENAAAVADEIRASDRRSLALGCRVEDGDAVRDAFDRVRAELGPIDVLVNNAGFSSPRPVLDMTEGDWDSHMAVNCRSIFLCSQAAARQMVAAGRGGAIINVGSIAGENAFPNRLAYCSSKAAVHQMTKVMALEWATHGIRVNCVAPGYVLTEMVAGLADRGILDIASLERRIPQHRLGRAEEIADAVTFLAGPRSSYLTGSVLLADGGWDAYGFV
jgi:NAD(P)-dependent dehydrogenase (short-subunit alcohol dehydrogenase family)